MDFVLSFKKNLNKIFGNLIFKLMLALVLVIGVLSIYNQIPTVSAQVSTDPNLKVAFIGDTGAGKNFESVLNLIKTEGTSTVVHAGDFGYGSGAGAFDSAITKVIGSSLPYFAAAGNHDVAEWTSPNGGYQAIFARRSGSYCTGAKGEKAACNFKGLLILELGIGTLTPKDDAGQVAFIKQQLAQSNAAWKVCLWHKNQNAMQVGGKGDEVGWQAYEACREGGAIIIAGHEHSYHRTKTLTSMQQQTIDPTCNTANLMCVAKGKTFVAVSGAGGNGIRVQQRCLPTTSPYGCNGTWAKVYTSDQGAAYGALFITFNYQGNPNRAHAYFKNVNNQIVDEFDITAGSSNITGQPTAVPTTPAQNTGTPVPTATPIPSPTGCASPPTNKGMVTKSFTINNGGNFRVWSRIMPGPSNANSYYLQIDSQCAVVVGGSSVPTNTWTWVDYKNGNTQSKIDTSLSAGLHTVKMIGKDDGLKLDRLIFTKDFNCIPTSTGDNCLAVPTVTPGGPTLTSAPTITPGGPTLTPTPTLISALYTCSDGKVGSCTFGLGSDTSRGPAKCINSTKTELNILGCLPPPSGMQCSDFDGDIWGCDGAKQIYPCIYDTSTGTCIDTGVLATPTPTQNSVLVAEIKLKFQGISKMPSGQSLTQPVRVTLMGGQLTNPITATTNFTIQNDLTWLGEATFIGASYDTDYTLYIKGPKHLQKKICENFPYESVAGSYSCNVGRIKLFAGSGIFNILDFSGAYLLVGDLPPQDGIINSYDLSLIKNNLSKKDPVLLDQADLNFDGIIDTQDYSLAIVSLSNRETDQ